MVFMLMMVFWLGISCGIECMVLMVLGLVSEIVMLVKFLVVSLLLWVWCMMFL